MDEPKPEKQRVGLYDAPQASLEREFGEGVGDVMESAEQMRREYLSREALIQALAIMFLINGGLLLLTGALSVALDEPDFASGSAGPVGNFIGALVSFLLGRGLRAYSRRARTFVTFVSVISLLSFPDGTAIGAAILYALHSARSDFVFTADYAVTMAQTEHIKPTGVGIRVLAMCGALLAVIVVTVVLEFAIS